MCAGSIAITAEVLHAGIAEPVGPQPHFQVQPLEHADAELALAFDRHHTGVRQLDGLPLESSWSEVPLPVACRKIKMALMKAARYHARA